ncbi:MAG: 30S ribosomal protein S2 [Patescibacteria group bacterium]|jgi:small subunit ribosomal protein S2|nr:30S ribosomal protein S2 [Patescibacteria group bacterium]
MPKIPDLMTMLKSGVHFGHQLSRRHPKMKPYIFTTKSGFHIINLEMTQEKLQEALDFVKKIVANGGTILFLATKKQAQSAIIENAKACNMPYITERWLGGTFTNFHEISRVVKKYTEWKKQQASGQLDKYTKKEKLDIEREIEKLDKIVGGIENMTKIPDAIFVIDIKKEKTAVAEANKRNIPVVAICDTNVNPDKVTYCIPGNDDAVKSIQLITGLVAQAVTEGLAERSKNQVAPKPAVAKK